LNESVDVSKGNGSPFFDSQEMDLGSQWGPRIIQVTPGGHGQEAAGGIDGVSLADHRSLADEVEMAAVWIRHDHRRVEDGMRQGVPQEPRAPANAESGLGSSPDAVLSSARIYARIVAKSPCPISKTQFLEKAEAVKITINGQELIADRREFSTGSFGWYHNGKVTVTVDGKPLSVQIGLNLTVVGSKEAER